MKKTLGANAKKEMIDAVSKCRTRAEVADVVAEYAKRFETTKATVYRVTRHVRPDQKTRSDKGNRVVDIRTDGNFKLMLGWMLNFDMTAADAYRTAKERGFNLPVVLETFERWLREQGLTEKTRRRNITPHRRFEAAAPGEMFQFDISGLKERWYDHETRRIINVSQLEVSKNHENAKASRTKVWRFALIDDYSRRCFIRYVGVAKPSSSHVVDFLLQAYAELGVPKVLYTDNDQIIKFGRNRRATEILNKALTDQGGYQNVFHLPGNSRATGKVERLHQTVERCEKAIGMYLQERGALSLEELNRDLAPRIEQHINTRVHGETGMAPAARWESAFSVIRRVKYDDLRAAFMADEHTATIKGDLSFRLNGETYQLPTSELYPFASWIRQKVTVVFHDDLDHYTVLGLDGIEYDIVKDTQRPDVAGDFKNTASSAEQLRREAKALAKEDAKRIKAGREVAPIPIFDTELAPAAEETNVSRFPKPETAVDPAKVHEAAPGRVGAAYAGVSLDYWTAYELLRNEFAGAAECKEFLNTVFASQDGGDKFLESELREAMDRRQDAGTERKLKAV